MEMVVGREQTAITIDIIIAVITIVIVIIIVVITIIGIIIIFIISIKIIIKTDLHTMVVIVNIAGEKTVSSDLFTAFAAVFHWLLQFKSYCYCFSSFWFSSPQIIIF